MDRESTSTARRAGLGHESGTRSRATLQRFVLFVIAILVAGTIADLVDVASDGPDQQERPVDLPEGGDVHRPRRPGREDAPQDDDAPAGGSPRDFPDRDGDRDTLSTNDELDLVPMAGGSISFDAAVAYVSFPRPVSSDHVSTLTLAEVTSEHGRDVEIDLGPLLASFSPVRIHVADQSYMFDRATATQTVAVPAGTSSVSLDLRYGEIGDLTNRMTAVLASPNPCDDPPSDGTRAFAALVQQAMLRAAGETSGAAQSIYAYYFDADSPTWWGRIIDPRAVGHFETDPASQLFMDVLWSRVYARARLAAKNGTFGTPPFSVTRRLEDVLSEKELSDATSRLTYMPVGRHESTATMTAGGPFSPDVGIGQDDRRDPDERAVEGAVQIETALDPDGTVTSHVQLAVDVAVRETMALCPWQRSASAAVLNPAITALARMEGIGAYHDVGFAVDYSLFEEAEASTDREGDGPAWRVPLPPPPETIGDEAEDDPWVGDYLLEDVSRDPAAVGIGVVTVSLRAGVHEIRVDGVPLFRVPGGVLAGRNHFTTSRDVPAYPSGFDCTDEQGNTLSSYSDDGHSLVTLTLSRLGRVASATASISTTLTADDPANGRCPSTVEVSVDSRGERA